MADTIKFYSTRGEHGFLSNFSGDGVTLDGKHWPTVEHYYQGQKTDKDEREAIRKAKTPRLARNMGQVCRLRQGWDDVKDEVMYTAVYTKFLQNLVVQRELLATGDSKLVEDSPIDWYWGIGKDGKGKNRLGSILMRVRTRLRDEVEAGP